MMKKLFFTGLAVLLTLAVIGCDGFTVPSQGNDEIPSVQYAKDGSSVTLNLNGGGVGKNLSRALTKDLAEKGHDFYEVVFYNSATEIARASWEIGQPAGIRNVPRGVAPTGINYGTADKAILFVGRKADKTLLAVGTLTATTLNDGTASGVTITSNTMTATFSVAALVAGTSFDAATSSFLTNDPTSGAPAVEIAQTTISDASCESNVFPMYRIRANNTTSATYTLGFNGGTATTYLPGIILSAAPSNNIRIPRFPIGGGNYTEFSNPHALGTTATVTVTDADSPPAVLLPDSALENPAIAISFDTSATTDGAVSFAFDIPVYAISKISGPGVPDSTVWHIKPGFGTNYYDLDNGNSPKGITPVGTPASYGGSILLGVGNNVPINYLGITATTDITYP
jgi:hypothetical protein